MIGQARWSVVGAIAFCMVGAQESIADFIKVDPRGSYLNSRFAPGFDAQPIDLTALGLYEGVTVRLRQFGDFSTHANGFDDTRTTLVGVFSNSSTLLGRPAGRPTPIGGTQVYQSDAFAGLDFDLGAGRHSGSSGDPTDSSVAFTPSSIKRVVGAIDYGPDYQTLHGDIEEDFLITDILVTIPQGARFLFLDTNDDVYADNTDPDFDFGITLAPVPEPSTFSALTVVTALCLARRRRA